MSTLTRMFTHLLPLASALGLAVCGGRTGLPLPPPRSPVTTVITFDSLAVGTSVDRQYVAQGVEFVRGPLFDGFGASHVLPWASDGWGGETRNRLVIIRPVRFGDPDADKPNLMWGTLRFPTQRVNVRVRNAGPSPVEVQLVVRDNQGTMRADAKWIPVNHGVSTPLQVKMDSPGLTQFVVFAAQRGVIAVDDVTLDHFPR